MNNLPIKQNNNIFNKIKNYLRKILKKDFNNSLQEEVEKQETINNTYNEQSSVDKMREIIKEEQRQEKTAQSLLNMIEKNPDLIYNLSNERLKQLITLYDDEIARITKKYNVKKL